MFVAYMTQWICRKLIPDSIFSIISVVLALNLTLVHDTTSLYYTPSKINLDAIS